MYNKCMKRLIIEIVIIVVVLALAGFGLYSAFQNFNNTLNPLKQANSELSTQVTQLLHPTPTIIPDPVTIIHDVQALARLETIQYTVEKVITADSGAPKIFEDKLLLVAHGTVIAGVDMAKMQPEDMWLDNGVLNVRLPAAEIFVATLDNDKTYVYDRTTSILTTANPDLETLARQAAEEQIRQAALDDGILVTAAANAESYLTRFFMALGYQNVVFVK
jgi:hypothetical protein